MASSWYVQLVFTPIIYINDLLHARPVNVDDEDI